MEYVNSFAMLNVSKSMSVESAGVDGYDMEGGVVDERNIQEILKSSRCLAFFGWA